MYNILTKLTNATTARTRIAQRAQIVRLAYGGDENIDFAGQ